jgi:hypothetical protein
MSIAPQVAISESFLTALAQLPKPTQKKVREFTTKFRTNPTSSAINYEALHGMRDPKIRTVRIDLAYRAVVVHPPAGALYMLVWVDHHDEAMAWAKNKVFDIHATTGVIQVVDMQFVEAVAVAPVETSIALFAALSDDDLARTGLPGVLVPAIRAVARDEDLEKLQPYLPKEAFEALFLVAAGYDLDKAIRESSRPPIAEAKGHEGKVVDTTDFAAALDKPATRRQFRLIESSDELEEMLDASLDRWRVFLHPTQDAIVRATFRGPARVLGGAGTGKTVVAMHRARHLAKLYPDDKVLFTAFNRNLAHNVSTLLDTLCGAERARIDVANIHSWAVGYANRVWGQVAVANAAQARECWQSALDGRAALAWTLGDYEREWTDVVQFHGAATRDEYLKASRAGSPRTLTRAQRVAIWEGLAAYRAELDRRGLVEWTDVVRRVRKHLEGSDEPSPYRAVVVDEAQDIDAEQWRLLRALAPDDDNSLFITGDAHQRIYGRPITLSHLGIHIRGRSYRLKINYRTTEQVLRWATRLVARMEVDDLDGGTDNTVGYRSLYAGPDPEVRGFGSLPAEAAFLVERVRALSVNTPPEEIAVVAGTRQRVNAYAAALDAVGIVHMILDGDAAGPGVRVATMHRVKGLDFSHVVMHMPSGDPSRDPRDLSLLYVAATRCRKTLSVMVS